MSEEKPKNEIKITRPNIDILVSTTEPLDKAVQTINELMDKYGETKKKTDST
jgi:hypothetical protein